jgi:hypothetical protein
MGFATKPVKVSTCIGPELVACEFVKDVKYLIWDIEFDGLCFWIKNRPELYS